ncbi:hypothetical protein K439DRAFT_1616261 [Ramaria rubella]|nr:hypothetical protein K439DRAFT_1616261 [Ramaria rubella]
MDEWDPNIDPSLYTPTKRIRLMTAALSGMSLGSFLVSSSPIASSQTIAPPVLEAAPVNAAPDWSLIEKQDTHSWQSQTQLQEHIGALETSLQLARRAIMVQDGIIEGSHAQLVIQDLHVQKLHQSLHAKEKQKQINQENSSQMERATIQLLMSLWRN